VYTYPFPVTNAGMLLCLVRPISIRDFVWGIQIMWRPASPCVRLRIMKRLPNKKVDTYTS